MKGAVGEGEMKLMGEVTTGRGIVETKVMWTVEWETLSIGLAEMNSCVLDADVLAWTLLSWAVPETDGIEVYRAERVVVLRVTV